MEIIHISAECYPVAKVGGLADVVGALPKYQTELGHYAKVVMPCYKNHFLESHTFELVHEGGVWMGNTWRHFSVIREKTNVLGFDLYLVDIPGLLDQEGVYGYYNDEERFTGFQIAVLNWINSWEHRPDIVHCHDHHSGLIPFMMTQCFQYSRLSSIPTVFTIHNGQYQGWMGWDRFSWIPAFDTWKSGLLDWNGSINSMAAAIRCSWKVTTVSPGYMEELRHQARGLEALFEYEKGKCVGILNGVDYKVWDPQTDEMIDPNYNRRNVTSGKKANKKVLCEQFQLDAKKPLVSFIGRLVNDKGADLLPDVIAQTLAETDDGCNFLVLGSGDPHIEWRLKQLKISYGRSYNYYLGYNESLSHLIYAGSDFLLMPSRVEPCGLNQLYSLRYGTVPIVTSVGGLKDTVIDFEAEGGYGICFLWTQPWDIDRAIKRGIQLYDESKKFLSVRQTMMKKDFSWRHAAEKYLKLYESL